MQVKPRTWNPPVTWLVRIQSLESPLAALPHTHYYECIRRESKTQPLAPQFGYEGVFATTPNVCLLTAFKVLYFYKFVFLRFIWKNCRKKRRDTARDFHPLVHYPDGLSQAEVRIQQLHPGFPGALAGVQTLVSFSVGLPRPSVGNCTGRNASGPQSSVLMGFRCGGGRLSCYAITWSRLWLPTLTSEMDGGVRCLLSSLLACSPDFTRSFNEWHLRKPLNLKIKCCWPLWGKGRGA